jgi:hypothetical protein
VSILPRPTGISPRPTHTLPRQRELLKQLVLGNHEIELAEGLLQALENMLAAFEYHRAIILERLDKMP